MSVATETTSVSSKRSTSPRPPAVGEEVKKFHDTPQHIPESYKNWNMECFSKTSCEDSVVRSMTPTCTENVTECTETSSNPSPPAAHKWAQSLHYLLEDELGCSLFQQFLKQDGQDTKYLFCWFLCRGVKKNDPSDPEGLVKLIKAVFKKIKRISAISDETKEEIRQKLATNTRVDDTIFDTAQREVEDYMRKTTYPNFLRSDLYIQHLGGWRSELSSEKEVLASPAPVDLLPTVHEDAELSLDSNKSRLTKSNLSQRNKVSSVYKLKPEGPAGFLRSPYNNYSSYHSKYGSYLPASAVDSELQSLSSDAQTDDAMSLADSSVVDFPLNSRSKQKHPQRGSKHIINKDQLINPPVFVPRTDRMPDARTIHSGEDPEKFFRLLSAKLNKLVDDGKIREKMDEKLKSVEMDVPRADSSARTCRKSNNANPMFESGFLYAPTEENVQDILDQHISRVFEDSGNHTPVGCLSPPPPVARPSCPQVISRVPPLRGYASDPADYAKGASHKHSQFSQYTVPNSIRLRKDHDTHSPESAMLDYVSNDNMNSSYRSPYSFGNSEPVDYSKRSKEHSKRYASKKLSAMTDSNSSFVDSGISLACESLPSYSKVTHWLEAKKLCEQERVDEMWRNSSTSPVLSRSSSSRKTSSYNNTRCSSQDVVCSQRPGASSQQFCQDSMAPLDTTSNLMEAKRRLEDENRSKMKLKSAQGSRNSHDMARMNHDMARMKLSSKGYDSYDDAIYHRKPNRKSCPSNVLESTPMNTGSNDVTVIGYSYGRQAVPYLSKLPYKNVTLKQFKTQLSKKGNFKYFFKTASDDFGTGVVFEEVTDDCQVLPLWEGKVFCVIESMDDNMVM